ncbi:thermonuclease family protein [Sphingomonas sp. LaA6.9]|uniref:thermonuclease family protein n=1 Tax=Sphingomonas sp. LaA6.9 TaxID=2919914 RepID=UPI001F4FA399|nr:thermonuclease family protein [Sphingomonas sp. LaA6.9]MCJ8157058.1 thermonuclease family protein [Sphingomonas sp. LaA6.9]
MMLLALVMAASLTGCQATDGDSIRCGDERIRLLGIDAPEMGRCPPQRRCADGDPVASRDNLRRRIAGRAIRVERIKKDRYGRTIAVVTAGGANLSCLQLSGHHATYRRDWDDGLRVARACRDMARR